MTRVINLDSDTCAQDALGRRVIDLDFALAQVRADAEKIYVKDPRVKGGGYYRVVKGGSGEGKDGKPKKGMSKGLKRGLQAAGIAVAAGSFAHSANEIRKEFKAEQQEKKEREEYLKNLQKEPRLTEIEKQRLRAQELTEKLKKSEEAAKGSPLITNQGLDREKLARVNEELSKEFSEKEIKEMMTGGLFDDEPEDEKKK